VRRNERPSCGQMLSCLKLETLVIRNRTYHNITSRVSEQFLLCMQFLCMQAAGDGDLPDPERVLIQALLHNGHTPFAETSAAMLVADLTDQPHTLLNTGQLHELYLADLPPEPAPILGRLKPASPVHPAPLADGAHPDPIEIARFIARGAPITFCGLSLQAGPVPKQPRLPLHQQTLGRGFVGDEVIDIPDRELRILEALLEEAQTRALTPEQNQQFRMALVRLWCLSACIPSGPGQVVYLAFVAFFWDL
jgi:hypothetical protein